MDININWNICRICLHVETKRTDGTEHMLNIFKEDSKLVKHIYDCSGIKMTANDNLPDKICQKCLTLVNNAINFRKTCRTSNAYLQSILQRTNSASYLFKHEKIQNKSDEEEFEEVEFLTQSESTSEAEFKHKSLSASEELNQLHHIINSNTYDFEDSSAELENRIVEINKIDDATNGKILKTKISLPKYLKKSSLNNLPFTLQQNNERIGTLSAKTIDTIKLNEGNASSCSSHIPEDKKVIEDENFSIISEDNFEYMTIEEDNYDINDFKVLRLEEQDSSIYIERHEQNSNLSNACNDFAEEKDYVEDEFINEDEIISENELSSEDNNVATCSKIQTESRKMRGLRNITVRSTKVALSRSNIKHFNYNSNSVDRGYIQQVYICKICSNQYKNRSNLHLHMKVHSREKNHQCELCLKRFITASNLRAHMRIHTGEKPFECQYCGRRFNDRSSNLRHERIHTNEKPFQCVSCDKSFALGTTLENHMKIHTGERSYRCEPCGKSFKLPHHLKSHQSSTQHKAVQRLGNLSS
ncbi:hypothetical protein DOY81_001063 [Sarcophaga bullata]|nr:hypothetical protein DOY81_001063 [Sarcophaga bullata]